MRVHGVDTPAFELHLILIKLGNPPRAWPQKQREDFRRQRKERWPSVKDGRGREKEPGGGL